MKKIILTGTHHSGKTTVLNYYKDHDQINIMGEIVRSLANEPNFYFKSDKPNYYAFSELALSYFYYGIAKSVNLLGDDKVWLFDRCIIDPLYYIKYFNVNLKLDNGDSLYNHILSLTKELIDSKYFDSDLFLLMKPIPIVQDDGFRMNEVEQVGVYDIAKLILQELGISYTEVDPTQAQKLINEYIEN